MTDRLVQLQPMHAHALELFLSEFDSCPEERNGYFEPRDAPIETVIESLSKAAAGIDLPEGHVPASTWFWESRGALHAVINVRHRLTPRLERVGGHIGFSVAPSCRRRGVATRMLGGVLEHCRALGISRALLTCDASNQGSWKAIEANGGVLEREDVCSDDQRLSRWYWIDLSR